MAQKADIFRFESVSDFLLTSYRSSKSLRPSWSYTAWARQMGGLSPEALGKISNGKRRIGPKLKPRFIRYFQFSEAEMEYFELLRIMQFSALGAPLKGVLMRAARGHLLAAPQKVAMSAQLNSQN